MRREQWNSKNKKLFTNACFYDILIKYGLADARVQDTPTVPWYLAVYKKEDLI